MELVQQSELPARDLEPQTQKSSNPENVEEPLPKFRFRGRIDTDFLWSDQTAINTETFGYLGDIVGLRRARIGAEGHLSSVSRYVGEIDLATGDVVVRDL